MLFSPKIFHPPSPERLSPPVLTSLTLCLPQMCCYVTEVAISVQDQVFPCKHCQMLSTSETEAMCKPQIHLRWVCAILPVTNGSDATAQPGPECAQHRSQSLEAQSATSNSFFEPSFSTFPHPKLGNNSQVSHTQSRLESAPSHSRALRCWSQVAAQLTSAAPIPAPQLALV